MKRCGRILFCWVLGLLVSGNAFALPKHGKTILKSPDAEFAVKISDTDEDYVYRLSLLHKGREVAHYKMEGELITAYWSPGDKYVAVNNHFGHGGWYVWIISLRDGSVITANKIIAPSSDYDRYLDYESFPDIYSVAGKAIKKVYPGYEGDHLWKGYSTIAYGWRSPDELLVYHEFIFEKLAEDATIHVRDVFKIGGKARITAQDFSVSKGSDRNDMDVPKEARKTINFW